MDDIVLLNCVGFEWDDGNLDKNQDKHKVSYLECEQVFFNRPLLLYDDTKHSTKEPRMYVLGKTNNDRLLFVVFTVSSKLIRVISARDMNKKERVVYEKNTKI